MKIETVSDCCHALANTITSARIATTLLKSRNRRTLWCFIVETNILWWITARFVLELFLFMTIKMNNFYIAYISDYQFKIEFPWLLTLKNLRGPTNLSCNIECVFGNIFNITRDSSLTFNSGFLLERTCKLTYFQLISARSKYFVEK